MENNAQTSRNKSSNPDDGRERLFLGSRHALYGGMIAGSVALGGQWLIGNVYSGYEARQLLESMSTSAHYLGSAVVTGSTTIIALMLTILSLTSQADDKFDRDFYHRIRRIGTLSMIALIGSIVLLLLLSIPVKESDSTPAAWFTAMYYVLMSFLALLAGLLISIVLMLQNAIGSLITVVGPSPVKEPRANSSDE